MYLARNKDGQIGRQVPGVGDTARVAASPMGERRGSVNVSARSIEEDQAYYGGIEAKARAEAQAKRLERIVRRKAQEIREQAASQKVSAFQGMGRYDANNERLKAFFARKNGMGESETVIRSLALPSNPADFSSSGANPQYVEGERMTGGDQWRADFRQHMIVGNPLTRDGEFGPAVTDYDRFVNGVDVNQTDVVEVVGGTMLGRLNDSGMGQRIERGANGSLRVRNPRQMRGMGFDWSWSGLVDTVSNVADQTIDNTIDSLPDQLAKELQNAISGGGQVTSSSGGTVVVQRPVVGATTTLSQTLGLPKGVLYAGVGLLGLGVVIALIKVAKS